MFEEDSQKNVLLENFLKIEFDRWRELTEPIDLHLSHVLNEAGTVLDHIYFQTTVIVSFVHVLVTGASAEIAVVGREGLVGISLLLGDGVILQHAVVQSAGHGFRINGKAFLEEFHRSNPVRHLLLRYAQAFVKQTGQTAVCNRHHSLDRQLCRWLLLSLDRLQENALAMTQELIAGMLKVCRESVAEAALKLKSAGLIQYGRGHIIVLDWQSVERRACECYHVVKKEYDRLLPASNGVGNV